MTKHAWLAGLSLAAAAHGCTPARLPALPPEPASSTVPAVEVVSQPEARQTRSVIVVTLDGVRWQEMYLGVDRALARQARMSSEEVVTADALLPNIYERMVKRGVALGAPGHGEPVEATGPNYVSLPGYFEIFTGSVDSRCRHNRDCEVTLPPTMADEVRFLAARDEDVAILTSWEVINHAASAAPDRLVISAGRHAGATRAKARVTPLSTQLLAEGARANPWPGHDDYRPDRITAPLALDYQKTIQPRFLFVGLGDTDEFAHANDYRGYLSALRLADKFIGDLFASLDQQGEAGAATSVILTTDHGRAANFRDHGGGVPESRRVFVMAAGGSIPAQGYVDAKAGRRLSSIAPTVRGLLGLGASKSAIDEPWATAGVSTPWALPSERVAGRP